MSQPLDFDGFLGTTNDARQSPAALVVSECEDEEARRIKGFMDFMDRRQVNMTAAWTSLSDVRASVAVSKKSETQSLTPRTQM
eukprot:1187761-Prorocentrum_minimum.AAC.4